jgi:hypothetical protein
VRLPQLNTLKQQSTKTIMIDTLLTNCKSLRELGETKEAWQCYQEAVSQPDVKPPVLAKLWYEGSILSFYNDKTMGLGLSYQALSSPYLSDTEYQCIHKNLVFYTPSLFSKDKESGNGETHKSTGYTYTTPTFLDDDVIYRLVNYSIDDRGSYTIRDPSGVVRTENEYSGRGLLQVSSSKVASRPDAFVQGLEDLRLTRAGECTIYGLAASFQYSIADNVVSQVLFQLDESTLGIDVLAVLAHSSHPRNEKNWVWLSFPLLIYEWYPKVSVLQVDPGAGTCSLYREIDSHPLLRYMRGSSNAVLYDGRYWLVTHSVVHNPECIRHYLHYLITLDDALTRVVDVSYPFTFLEKADIEFCTALKASGEGLTFGWSSRDRDPQIAQLSWERARNLFPRTIL